MRTTFLSTICLLPTLLVAGTTLANGQQNASRTLVPSRITQTIDSGNLVTLPGHVRRDLTPDKDLGAVEDSMPIRLYLVLKRSPEQEADLNSFLARQQQPGTAEYHKWLTPKEFGARFGAAPADIAKINTWLESQGMQVKSVLNNASMIEFESTASGIRNTFHVQMHYWNIQGGKYVANANDPQIPAALNGVVGAINGLNKIPAQSKHTAVHPVAYDSTSHRWHNVEAATERGVAPKYTDGQGNYDLSPGDFYTIYNVSPIYNTGNLGAGATIGLPEPTDMNYGTVNSSTGQASGGDVNTFRTTFGVAGTLNMTVMHGAGTVTCNDPGLTGAEGEANLDAEWANAAAPSAHLLFMSCDNSNSVGDGFTTALVALIDNNLSDIISSSYGSSEITLSQSDYAMDDTLAMQAATQGQSFIDAAGDAGSADADQNTTTTAVNGLNVDQYAGTPLVTAVGGTDFSDRYDADQGGLPQSTYWSSTNNQFYADALSYIPETPWNSSCADSIIANDANIGGGLTPAAYCGLGPATNTNINGAVVGGGGGFSAHYAQPSYQTGVTGLSSTATNRAVPDIAFFAANGFWGHDLLVCDSTTTPPMNCSTPAAFGGAGGTSFTAPQFAGVTALLVTASGERQGTLNPAIYALAKAQFTATATQTACYSNGQTNNVGVTTGLPATACIFHDVTTGNNDEPCQAGSTSCFVNPGAQYGLLSTTGASSLTIGYPSGPGYDEATGLGSLNIANFINNFNQAFTSSTSLSANPTTIAAPASTQLTATVTGGEPAGYTGTAPALTGSVTFTAGTMTVGSCTLISGHCSANVNASQLQSGPNSLTATFTSSATYPSSTSAITTVTLTPPGPIATTTTASINPTSFPATTPGVVTVHVSCNSACGTVEFTEDGAGWATVQLDANGNFSSHGPGPSWSAGPHTVTVYYLGNSQFAASTSNTVNFTITAGTTATTTTATIDHSSFPATTPGIVTVHVSCNSACGNVAFKEDGAGWATVALDANGNFSTHGPMPNWSAGQHSVQVMYLGNSQYAQSYSNIVPFTITAGATATTTTATVNQSSFPASNPGVFSVHVSCNSACGSVGFREDGVGWATVALDANGNFSSHGAPPNTTPGPHTVTVMYLGNSQYAGSTSNTVSFTIVASGPVTIQ